MPKGDLRASWAQALAAGLSGGRIPRNILAALALYMDPPEADPLSATYSVAMCGTIRSYFCNGRRMFHRELLDKRFVESPERNTFPVLRSLRRQVDAQLAIASDRAAQQVARIHHEIEELYLNPSLPTKPIHEAFLLGKCKAILEASDIAEDAARMRWILNGNGYFLEERAICGHAPCHPEEQNQARRAIDMAMEEG